MIANIIGGIGSILGGIVGIFQFFVLIGIIGWIANLFVNDTDLATKIAFGIVLGLIGIAFVIKRNESISWGRKLMKDQIPVWLIILGLAIWLGGCSAMILQQPLGLNGGGINAAGWLAGLSLFMVVLLLIQKSEVGKKAVPEKLFDDEEKSEIDAALKTLKADAESLTKIRSNLQSAEKAFDDFRALFIQYRDFFVKVRSLGPVKRKRLLIPDDLLHKKPVIILLLIGMTIWLGGFAAAIFQQPLGLNEGGATAAIWLGIVGCVMAFGIVGQGLKLENDEDNTNSQKQLYQPQHRPFWERWKDRHGDE